MCAAFGQAKPDPEPGIPVSSPLVIAKCGTCHARDERGNMERISWARSTPEGWQDVVRRMAIEHNVPLTQAEAVEIVKSLSGSHGLAPAESKPVMYLIERRVHDETGADDPMHAVCGKCHSISRALQWRRSDADWKLYAAAHAATYKFRPNDLAVAVLAKTAPLHTPEWDAWSARKTPADFAGRWLVTASIPGRGKFYGEMQVDGAGGEYNTRVILTSLKDESKLARTGRAAIYGDNAWRGRSKGSPAAGAASDPESPLSEVREVMWIAPDHLSADGRWFWGRYQEFGFDVHLERPSASATLMLVDRPSLKTGSQSVRVRLIGDNFPAQVAATDIQFGAGVNVRSVASHTQREIVAIVDVAATAPLGKREVSVKGARLTDATAIYDRIDYLRVTPQSAMASFSDAKHPPGYRQFEATGYQKGPDGKMHTADDVDLGPVDVAWSVQVFHAPPGSQQDFVGTISPQGLFSPGADNPNSNFDVWAIATARDEKDARGAPLTDKCYMVVTVPSYIFNGRRYVRDLDRWVDDGSATSGR
ncbi:MAG TPA: quinohemoprotein amine dehydrogenase subunit alpha [Bryobacteraceae bacterium]|jgi:quinohemoprotein amine dehydrogenase|nr:quinohemoprotein amine dehydrogenase subunit alpha [Bryobacteraceae bacterium]